ncbi:Uu.00g077040.m01.CDS01 [Anthostomella pinea]|uniref:Uu.00g077040.m01.CDS01 n=1 Tax=Anthostomella pinea TaxID=933095 RepID=A0AAI8YP64_9PEZI|nr:Uu.00g077040.m01.CDS01 [Anthostomella pinea]
MAATENPPSFTCFLSLPPELQLMIWDRAKHRTAILEIQVVKGAGTMNRLLMPPSAAGSCVMARQAIMGKSMNVGARPEHTTWTDWRFPWYEAAPKQYIWFDSPGDILYWNTHYSQLDHKPMLQHLEIQNVMVRNGTLGVPFLKHMFEIFPRLKSTAVLLGAIDLELPAMGGLDHHQYALVDLENPVHVEQQQWDTILKNDISDEHRGTATSSLEESLEKIGKEGIIPRNGWDWATFHEYAKNIWLDVRNVDFPSEKSSYLFRLWVGPQGHTLEYHCWAETILPDMSQLRKVAFVRIQGDIGGLLQGAAVEIGKRVNNEESHQGSLSVGQRDRDKDDDPDLWGGIGAGCR